MSLLKEATSSIRFLTCNIYGHMAKDEDLENLILNDLQYVDGYCCKCESPIRITLDIKNSKRYNILER